MTGKSLAHFFSLGEMDRFLGLIGFKISPLPQGPTKIIQDFCPSSACQILNSLKYYLKNICVDILQEEVGVIEDDTEMVNVEEFQEIGNQEQIEQDHHLAIQLQEEVSGPPLMIWGGRKSRQWIYFFRGNAF